jgi:hypothetical protein
VRGDALSNYAADGVANRSARAIENVPEHATIHIAMPISAPTVETTALLLTVERTSFDPLLDYLFRRVIHRVLKCVHANEFIATCRCCQILIGFGGIG